MNTIGWLWIGRTASNEMLIAAPSTDSDDFYATHDLSLTKQ